MSSTPQALTSLLPRAMDHAGDGHARWLVPRCTRLPEPEALPYPLTQTQQYRPYDVPATCSTAWHGYAGHWHLRAHNADPNTRINRGMRLWNVPAQQQHPEYFLVQHNVYEQKMPIGTTTEREQDGFFEAEYFRRIDDVAYAVSAAVLGVSHAACWVQMHFSISRFV